MTELELDSGEKSEEINGGLRRSKRRKKRGVGIKWKLFKHGSRG
jgi:hypothetical protein